MLEKVVVLGKGFLGKKFEQRGFEVWGKDVLNVEGLTDLSVLDPYNIIINCIGKSNTRWCENRDNFAGALWSNGLVPGILSKYCAAEGKRFVHVSTGCLYDDGLVAQDESSLLAAHCNYTVTKWVGEQRCRDNDLILRPRLFFGDTVDRNNLLCKLPKFKKFITVCNSYTSTDVIVNATIALILNKCTGVFNVACDGFATVSRLATLIGVITNSHRNVCITPRELCAAEHLHLVNNCMNIHKLKEFYQPPLLKDEIMRCWRAIQ